VGFSDYYYSYYVCHGRVNAIVDEPWTPGTPNAAMHTSGSSFIFVFDPSRPQHRIKIIVVAPYSGVLSVCLLQPSFVAALLATLRCPPPAGEGGGSRQGQGGIRCCLGYCSPRLIPEQRHSQNVSKCNPNVNVECPNINVFSIELSVCRWLFDFAVPPKAMFSLFWLALAYKVRRRTRQE
jgi:hypothetical protein